MRGFESRLRRLEGGGVCPLYEEARGVLLKSIVACEPGATPRYCEGCGRNVPPTVFDIDKLLELEVGGP